MVEFTSPRAGRPVAFHEANGLLSLTCDHLHLVVLEMFARPPLGHSHAVSSIAHLVP